MNNAERHRKGTYVLWRKSCLQRIPYYIWVEHSRRTFLFHTYFSFLMNLRFVFSLIVSLLSLLPAAAFWTSPDPLCEKYYNISPYAFCNNNPVTFIDPDGRKWKTLEDKEKATRIQEISMFHVRSLEKAIQKIKRKIEVNDISLSEKARNRKIKRYKENLSELQYKKIF